MSYVRFEAVEKRYNPDDEPAVQGLNIDVNEGEFLVLVGPSGCGKSTTLRMLAGLEDITSGSISIDGARVNDLPPSARGVGMVFQSYALYPHMTVEKNLSFGLRMARGEGRLPAKEIEARASAPFGWTATACGPWTRLGPSSEGAPDGRTPLQP